MGVTIPHGGVRIGRLGLIKRHEVVDWKSLIINGLGRGGTSRAVTPCQSGVSRISLSLRKEAIMSSNFSFAGGLTRSLRVSLQLCKQRTM